jgi:DNA topoisomerase-3
MPFFAGGQQKNGLPAIVTAITQLRGFAHLQINWTVIRRGKSGHFCCSQQVGIAYC